ncbi:MAG: metal-sensitive transcriptional regulator [Burkholderiaceae bacterium]|nr:metal-sensitive transcriptional regulator [Burkholderiaceae bacterium]
MAGAKSAALARHALVVRLKRVEGQLRGIQSMIESGADCEAIAQQLSAARKALDRAFYELLACALEHPQFSAEAGESDAARVQRIARTLAKFA